MEQMEQSLIEHKNTLNELAGLIRDEIKCAAEVYPVEEAHNRDLSMNALNNALVTAKQEFIVPVLGGFASGKSSLINAFLGEEISPTFWLAMLSLIYELRYGASKRITVYPLRGRWKGGEGPFDLPVDVDNFGSWIDDNLYIRSDDDIDNYSPIAKVVISLPLDILKSGVVLVDTPGGVIHDPWFLDDFLRDYLLRVDLIVYTMSCVNAYSGADKKALDRINALDFRNIVTAYTCCDVLRVQGRNPEELRRIQDILTSYAVQYTDLEVESVHYLSSLDALRAKQTDDTQAMINSGFKGFEDFLGKYLVAGPGTDRVRVLTSVVIRQAYKMIVDSRSAHHMNQEARGTLMKILQKILNRASGIRQNYGIQENAMIQDGINTLKEVIDLLPPDKRTEFLTPLQAIEKRFLDPYFYLSIIGNFSSGKSTFLNALLDMDLLSVDDLPTTAIPTFIRWDRSSVLKARGAGNSAGADTKNPCIKVILTDGKSYYLDNLSGNDTNRFMKETKISIPEDIGNRIDYITTRNELASKIQRVELSFPERPEFRNFCLIDTPGINPGQESNAAHILNTQSILRETSDCAIILYPGMNTMTANTKKFVEDNADHLLGNAIVLLTKMDLIPRKDWDKIYQYTVKILRDQFHQEQPLVYMISAWLTQEFQSGRNTTEEAQNYAESFTATAKEIMQTLRTRRIEIVSRRLLQLMNNLAASLESVMVDYRNTQIEQSELLHSHSWESVQKDVSQIQQKFKQSVKNQNQFYRGKIAQIVSDHIQSAYQKVCDRIDAASNRSQLNDACESFYQEKMADAQSAAISQIQADVFRDVETKYKSRFVDDVTGSLKQHEYYLGILNSSSLKTIDRGNLTVDISTGDNGVSFLGGNAVKIIGLAFGLIGFAVGWFIDRVRLEFYKDKAKEAVRDNCAQMEEELKENLQKQFNRFKQGLYDWSEHILDTYQVEYRNSYLQAERSYLERESVIALKLAQYTKAVETLGALREAIDAKTPA